MKHIICFVIAFSLFVLSCNISIIDNGHDTIYIYNGRYGFEVLARVEGYSIYEGRYDMKVLYSIHGNTVYEGLYEKPVYRIDDNFIYDYLYSDIIYRIENNFIYRGRYSLELLYRLETR